MSDHHLRSGFAVIALGVLAIFLAGAIIDGAFVPALLLLAVMCFIAGLHKWRRDLDP